MCYLVILLTDLLAGTWVVFLAGGAGWERKKERET
jgi:hypothetical protein